MARSTRRLAHSARLSLGRTLVLGRRPDSSPRDPWRIDIVQLLDGFQSALNPHSPEAAATAGLAWVLIIGAAIIFIAVMALAVACAPLAARLARATAASSSGAASHFRFVVLTVLLVYSATRGVSPAQREPAALRIEVVGHQWWWRVRYLDAGGGLDFETANEIRLPVGQRVELALASADVLHSFWVPNLAGKLDMIPGRINRLTFTPGTAAVFRGQCAEYCGGPHAQMALYVVTLSAAAFEQWRATSASPRGRVRSHVRIALRRLPHGARIAGAGHAGPRPHARRQPALDRRRHAAHRRGAARPLDRLQPARQARQPDARVPRVHGDELAALAAYLASLR